MVKVGGFAVGTEQDKVTLRKVHVSYGDALSIADARTIVAALQGAIQAAEVNDRAMRARYVAERKGL